MGILRLWHIIKNILQGVVVVYIRVRQMNAEIDTTQDPLAPKLECYTRAMQTNNFMYIMFNTDAKIVKSSNLFNDMFKIF